MIPYQPQSTLVQGCNDSLGRVVARDGIVETNVECKLAEQCKPAAGEGFRSHASVPKRF